MAFYKKKPVVIEAKQLTEESFNSVVDWVPDCICMDGISISIPTLEGNMLASPGDYIIKGTHGEFYPCKPNIFEENYVNV
jgi:hypothetical protein